MTYQSNTRRLLSRCVLAAAASLAMLGATEAHAGVVGTANTGNCYPFSCAGSFNVTRYQQVYSATAFSGLSAISAMNFLKSSGGMMDYTTYSLSLSTTSKAVGELDTTDTDNNIGSDNTFLGSWTLWGMAMPEQLTFSFPEFVYDPSAGNLLLTVDIFDTYWKSYAQSFFQADTSGTVMSRVFTNQYGTFGDNTALVTSFNVRTVTPSEPTNPVPEPATLALSALGLAALAARRKTTA